jgi:hypothetical protein
MKYLRSYYSGLFFYAFHTLYTLSYMHFQLGVCSAQENVLFHSISLRLAEMILFECETAVIGRILRE